MPTGQSDLDCHSLRLFPGDPRVYKVDSKVKHTVPLSPGSTRRFQARLMTGGGGCPDDGVTVGTGGAYIRQKNKNLCCGPLLPGLHEVSFSAYYNPPSHLNDILHHNGLHPGH